MIQARIAIDQSSDAKTPAQIELRQRLPVLLIDLEQIQHMRERRRQLDRLRAWAAQRQAPEHGGR